MKPILRPPEGGDSGHRAGAPAPRRTRSPEWIPRPRLFARLQGASASRVAVVQAPAGYGKSTLLQQWHAALKDEGAAVTWLTVTAAQRDPIEFFGQIIRAVEVQAALALPPIKSFMAGGAFLSPELIATRIADRFIGTTAYLFFDDVHQLAGSPSIACLKTLIECAPSELHIVLSTREKLDLPFGRLRAHGELCEIAPRDLCFNEQEVAALFAQAGLNGLSRDELKALEQRSEGWPVGLRLAVLALKSNARHEDVVRTFSGERSEIWEFFAEDVLSGQPEEVQEFLLRTSVLDRASAALCDAVTGMRNGREMLEHCEKAGLFLFPLDETRSWYRFHHLFREFLHRTFSDRLNESLVNLHSRASAWLFEAGLFNEAFEHALKAKDPIRAAEMLDSRLDAMFSAGEARLVRRLAGEIPPHIQAFYPRIMLAAAWPLAVHWKFAEARNLLTASRARLAELERLDNIPKKELENIRHLLMHREMMLAQVQDDVGTLETLGSTLIRTYTDAHPFVAGSIYSGYLAGKREQYKLFDINRLDAAATDFLRQCDSPQVFVAHEAVVGQTRFMAGETEAAIERLRHGLDITVRLFGPSASIGATCALPLAEILFERNELDEARRLLDGYLPVATEMGFVDQLISGWITLARMQQRTGEGDGALRTLSTASAFAAQSGFERLGLFVADERVRHHLAAGRPDEAARTARRAGVKTAMGAVMPSGAITRRDEVRARLWVRWAETQNRIADGLNVARQWRSFTASAGALHAAVRWDIMLAHLLLLDGQFRGAKRTLRRAIAVAAPCRYMRSFLDEPALLGALLADAPIDEPPANDKTAAFTAELTHAYENERGKKSARGVAVPEVPRMAGLGGALSAHEIEVLRLAAAGMTNREVGDRLGMTEGSIKWHLQQVYDKIGVRRRLQAIERARHLGLIG